MIRQLLATAACAAFALPAAAQEFVPARTGFYNGTNTDKPLQRPGLDVTGSGQFAGYLFNRHLNAELGVRQLADTEVTKAAAPLLNGQVADKDLRIEQTSLSLMARYPVAEKVDLYGRAGYQHTEYKSDDGRRTSVNEAVAGAGASYTVSPKAQLRMETQRVKSRAPSISVGAGLNF